LGKAWAYLAIASFALRMVPFYVSARVNLWWKAREGRRAFEDELRRQGMSEEGVVALGMSYSKMKDEVSGFFTLRNWV